MRAGAYRLGVWGKSYDRIGFRVGSNACFAPDTPAGNPVYLGAERVLLTKDSINLSRSMCHNLRTWE